MESIPIVAALSLFLALVLTVCSPDSGATRLLLKSPPPDGSLCARMLQPLGYPCTEHTVQTKDGFLLTLQRIPHGKNALKGRSGLPVFLQHGLFQEFWDWSWQELAQHDLADMITYVYSETKSKVFYVGHSQGTIMALAAFTMPDTVKMIEAAALLCPISFLDHLSSRFVLRAVKLNLDKMLINLGIHQLNFRSDIDVQLVDYLCDGHMDCNSLLSAITGENCCFNKSRVEYYLEYEPHPSSTKNLNHLFQMIRKGTFAKYDYGLFGNLRRYGHMQPPAFDLKEIPESLPLWMGYGGSDALADVTDVKRTIKALRSEPELLYIQAYGHIDFVMSVKAKDDVYGSLMRFFRSIGDSSSY